MDVFVSRKRAFEHSPSNPPVASWGGECHQTETEEDDSTETKLAILASLNPQVDTEVLLETLLLSDGSIEDAHKSLESLASNGPPRKKQNSLSGYQSSLSSFAGTSNSPKSLQNLTRKGKTLHLYSPADIAAHTPCSLIHNFLPAALADALLRELVTESVNFKSETFRLFENTVTSPHTMSFYVDNPSSAYLSENEDEAKYAYNGNPIPVIRTTTQHMREAAGLVQPAVNTEIAKRITEHYPNSKRLRYQSPHPWIPNTSFVNCYDGAKQSVGWHADQLTYLGPRAVIGSVSLGVAREFRVRRVVARDGPTETGKQDTTRADTEGQISIHLPHNSLLIMHAEMQEEWKHSIAPAQTITPHPIAGNKRINVTYRHYRDSFAPKFTPKCRCNVPCVLKCVAKQERNRGRYVWMCCSGYSAERGKEGCGMFEWARLSEEGELLGAGDA